MKLIAENQHENSILGGLSALLCDLGVDVDSYRQDDAIAVTFISLDPLSMPDELYRMTKEEQTAFLYSIEDSIRRSMLAAGYRSICRALHQP